jgi:hypothetical protein
LRKFLRSRQAIEHLLRVAFWKSFEGLFGHGPRSLIRG